MTEESTRPSAPVTVRISGEGALVASLPAMLGFTPSESLVVFAMHRREGRTQVGGMVRTDLPVDATDERAVSRLVRDRLAPTGPIALHVVVIAARGHGGDLPQRGLIEALGDAFAPDGIAVTSAVWTPRITGGGLWRCYGTCGCTGTLPDPGATEAAAHTTMAGQITYRSREDVEAALEPDPGARTRQRRELLDAAHRAAHQTRAHGHPQAARADLAAIRSAAATIGAGQSVDEPTMARVLVALTDPPVRDVCLGFAMGCDDEVRPEHAEKLWWSLTRAAPAPEAAEPATLVAFAAIAHGGGAPMTVALDRATTADPDHRLSRLLATLLAQGADPTAVRELITSAVTKATTYTNR